MPDEVKRWCNFLLKYLNTEHSLSGVGPAYFVASKSLITNELKKILKYELPNFDGYIRRNRHEIRLLQKYYKNTSTNCEVFFFFRRLTLLVLELTLKLILYIALLSKPILAM